METHNRRFKGVWIKASIWDHPELTWLQKCVAAEIDALSDDNNPCTASNKYLASMFKISPGRMANILVDLRELNIITVTEFDGKTRCLRLGGLFTETVKGAIHGNREGLFTETVKGGGVTIYTKGTSRGSVASLSLVFEGWNKNAENTTLPKCLVLSDKRRRALESRLRDEFFAENWRAALQKILKSEFLTGTNDRGWTASFDWFIQPDSVIRIMEGKYSKAEKKDVVGGRF